MRRARRRRGRRKGRPLFVVTLRSVLGVLAASLLISIIVSKGVIPVTAVGPLKGYAIFIDPGHGGIDPGACGITYTEKDIVLKVALLLGARFEQSGAKVVYTRTGDCDLESSDVSDVEARIGLMKESKATIALSIHCNAFTDSYETGAQVFYNATKHPGSKKLAQLIQDELVRSTGTEREISARLDHFILNHAEIPAVTVELGFLSNPGEENLLGSAKYQQELASCIYEAVLAFLASE
ncbi:MAG TPA: N-acetylmuramoyl-L-alanine amidase [Firmicutes bacterium]|nr:N-acetylmuramoyl-L-alanine amidase [Candidatus Fermentithermobacillaceae bacterium]